MVLTPRRWRQASRKYPRDDGDKRARSPGRVRRKPLKPLCAGMPGDPGALVVTNARAFYTTRAAAGATGTRHSPLPAWVAPAPLGVAPLPFWGAGFKHNSGASRRENAQICLAVIAIRTVARMSERDIRDRGGVRSRISLCSSGLRSSA